MGEACVRVPLPLWLWTAVSRRTRLFLGPVTGDRGDAALERLPDEEMHRAWRGLPACTRPAPSRAARPRTRALARTSVVEARKRACPRSTPRSSVRQCPSGMARESCGVSRRIIDDPVERFLIFVERHNRHCPKVPRTVAKTSGAERPVNNAEKSVAGARGSIGRANRAGMN